MDVAARQNARMASAVLLGGLHDSGGMEVKFVPPLVVQYSVNNILYYRLKAELQTVNNIPYYRLKAELQTIFRRSDQMSMLNRDRLRGLLERLGPSAGADSDESAEEYIKLQRRLIIFFESQRPFMAEDLADQTLDRVMRILDEGEKKIEDIRSFTLGVARNILRETWKKPPPEPLPESHSNRPSPVTPNHNSGDNSPGLAELRYECCQKCLAENFSDGDRNLLIGYYQHEGRARIEHHRVLARELGVSENALRIRACRLRA